MEADRLLELLESFHRLTGIATALLYRDGRIVTSESRRELAVGWQRICVEFHRQHPDALERCRESDTRISSRLEAGDRYTCYECLNGLVDAAVPIMVDGEHVLTLFTGQFFFEAPDRERFRRQAAELGIDEEGYLAALDEVPVMARETVEEGMLFLTRLAELIGELVQGQRRIEREVEERTRELHEANRALREAKEGAEREAAERQRLEVESRDALRHLRDVLESTTDAFFEVEADFTVTYINEKAESILGWGREDLVGMNLWEAFPDAVGTRFEAEYRRALSEQVAVEFEEYHPPRGTWYEVHAYPTTGSLSVYFRDITRRKQAEDTLLEYQRVIEHTDDLIGVVDPNATYRLVNRAFLQQLEIEREEVIGRTVAEVLGEKAYEGIRPHLERAFAGEAVEYEMVYDHAEGPRTLLTRYDPIRDDSGEVVLAAVMIRDNTNLRKAEKELENFFHLSMDMLCVAGFDGYFKQLNPAWERTLGWTEEELLGSPWIDFVHPDDVQPTIDAGQDLTRGRDILSFENRYRCKDGSYRWLSWNSRPLPEQGLIYAAVRDVTAAKEAEEALRDRERLQGALETAGAVCHELNQPLQAITGFTDLLLLDVMDQEGLSEKARKIQEAVRLMNGITRKLSGITRYHTMDYLKGKIIDIDRSSESMQGTH
jgi:PAS domain S-box-containing protein